MDYEKIHELSLELGRKLIQENPELREWVESKLPELRESEDERARKWLVELVKNTDTNHSNVKLSENCKLALAYLEKQKDAFENGRQLGIMQEQARQELGWPDEKQKEQKPNYCHHEVDETGWTEEYRKAYYDGWNNCNMQHEQLKAGHKPTEWSEEDKDYYDTIVRKLEVIGDDCGLSNNQIKFLREHCPSHCLEWSEEDETIIEGACNALEIYGHTKLASMLKSLRPQSKQGLILTEEQEKKFGHLFSRPSWKPSDEQMAGLLVAVGDEKERGSDIAKTLRSLYEHLKKL